MSDFLSEEEVALHILSGMSYTVHDPCGTVVYVHVNGAISSLVTSNVLRMPSDKMPWCRVCGTRLSWIVLRYVR